MKFPHILAGDIFCLAGDFQVEGEEIIVSHAVAAGAVEVSKDDAAGDHGQIVDVGALGGEGGALLGHAGVGLPRAPTHHPGETRRPLVRHLHNDTFSHKIWHFNTLAFHLQPKEKLASPGSRGEAEDCVFIVGVRCVQGHVVAAVAVGVAVLVTETRVRHQTAKQ